MLVNKVSVPIVLAGSLIVGGMATGRVLGASREQLESATQDVAKLKDQRVQDALDLRELRTKVDEIARGIDRMERRMGTHP